MLLNRRDGDSVPGYRVRRWSPTRRAQARATLPFQGRASPMARCLEAATRAPLAPPLPACGERSDSERSEGIRVRGRSRESELADKPPHPICFASQGLRSQIDLSPHAAGLSHMNWDLEVRGKTTCATSPRVGGEVGFRAQRRNPGEGAWPRV